MGSSVSSQKAPQGVGPLSASVGAANKGPGEAKGMQKSRGANDTKSAKTKAVTSPTKSFNGEDHSLTEQHDADTLSPAASQKEYYYVENTSEYYMKTKRIYCC